jgi:hypothetical protein
MSCARVAREDPERLVERESKNVPFPSPELGEGRLVLSSSSMVANGLNGDDGAGLQGVPGAVAVPMIDGKVLTCDICGVPIGVRAAPRGESVRPAAELDLDRLIEPMASNEGSCGALLVDTFLGNGTVLPAMELDGPNGLIWGRSLLCDGRRVGAMTADGTGAMVTEGGALCGVLGRAGILKPRPAAAVAPPEWSFS